MLLKMWSRISSKDMWEHATHTGFEAPAQISWTTTYILATSLGDLYTYKSLRSNPLRHIDTLWNIWDNWKNKGFEAQRWAQELGRMNSQRSSQVRERKESKTGSRIQISGKLPSHFHRQYSRPWEQLNALKTYYCDTNLLIYFTNTSIAFTMGQRQF